MTPFDHNAAGSGVGLDLAAVDLEILPGQGLGEVLGSD